MPSDAQRPAEPEVAAGLSRWQDLVRERFVALDIRVTGGESTFAGAVTEPRSVGPLAVATVQSHGQTFRRTARLIDRYGEDYVQVGRLRRGEAQLEQDGRRCRLSSGGFAVYDTTRPFTWTMNGPWSMDVLTWPRQATALDYRRARSVTALALGPGALAQVARAAMVELARVDAPSDGAEGVVLASQVAYLVFGAAEIAGSATVVRAPADVALSAVLDFVELHVRDPSLTPRRIADRFHISLRSLQRLFADQPRSVAGWIRHRRLDRARAELAGPCPRPVAVVAARYCFSTPTVFARAFREEYGCSPRDVQQASGIRPSPPAPSRRAAGPSTGGS